MKNLRVHTWMLLGAGLVLAAGCRDRVEEPAVEQPEMAETPETPSAPRLTSIDLGTSIGPDRKIVNETDTFGPRDTIYVAVNTTGDQPNATLTARWSFEDGQVVDSTSHAVQLAGDATTEFHIAKATRWPVGKYKVEVFLNGDKLGEEEFEIKANPDN
jgi:hypothetical protein